MIMYKRTNRKYHTSNSSGFITFMLVSSASTVRSLKISKRTLSLIAAIFIFSVAVFAGFVLHMNSLSDNAIAYKNKVTKLEKEMAKKEQQIALLISVNSEYTVQLNTVLNKAQEMEDQFNQLMFNKVLIDNKLDNLKATGQPEQEPIVTTPKNVEHKLIDIDYFQLVPNGIGGASFFDQVKILESTLNDNAWILDEQLVLYEDLNDKVEKMMPYILSYPSILPVNGRITSPMGWRNDPFNPSRRQFHGGIDLASTTGSPVKASGGGIVTFSSYYGGYGHTVIIDHGYGITTLYAHNSKLLVKRGDKVNRGDDVALSGSSGRSTGPHVHYEVRFNGTPKDPLTYISKEE